MRRKKTCTIVLCLLLSIAGLSMPAMYFITEMGGTDGGDDGYSDHQYPPMPLVPNRSDVPDTPIQLWPTTTYRPCPPAVPPQQNGPIGYVNPQDDPSEEEMQVVLSPSEPSSTSDEDTLRGPLARFDITIEPRVARPLREDDAAKEDPLEDPHAVKEVPKFTVPELEVLTALEGRKNFRWSTSPDDDIYWYGRRDGVGQGQGQSNGETAPGGIGSFGEDDEREVEEADIVYLDGTTLYVLNAYKGLITVDVSDPDAPVVLSIYPVLGDPVDMYIVDHVAYMMVRCDFGYWYGYSAQSLGGAMGQAQVEVDGMGAAPEDDVSYKIGSKLVVVDLEDPNKPLPLVEVSIEGLVRDSRKVGDVIYVVSTCHSWYNSHTRTKMMDLTYVVSLNVMDIRNILLADTTFFDGHSYVIHASSRYLYVSESNYVRSERDYETNITMVDISDPRGTIGILGRMNIDGRVGDKYQMDEYGETFRVVSHLRDPWTSKLWTFDISDPFYVEPLGRLLIDDEGDLRATRFEGDRVYTIHLPRRPDPLDIIDISDPANPVQCSILQMPGWVEHLEVRGDRLLAVGVDDSNGQTSLHFSLFDVSDPYEPVMKDRVLIGKGWTQSEALDEPKALTILDDQGVALIPFSTSYRESGVYHYECGVQVISFDLEKCDLVNRGTIVMPDNVLRTRSMGDRILSTSADYLVVADVMDLDNPKVTATIGLSPYILDYHVTEGRFAELIYSPWTHEYSVKVFNTGDLDINPPLLEIDIGTQLQGCYWDGTTVHIATFYVGDDERMYFDVSTLDLLGSSAEPRFQTTIDVGHYTTINRRIWMIRDIGDPWSDCTIQNYHMFNSEIGNPVMLDGGVLALYTDGNMWFVPLPENSIIGSWIHTEVVCDNFYGLLPAGEDVYLIEKDWTREYVQRKSYYLYHYWAALVDVHAEGGPKMNGFKQVPGLPMGCSDDGSLIYTLSYWYNQDTGQKQSLNVVNMAEEDPTVIWAVDVLRHYVKLMDDLAMISKVTYYGYEDADGNVRYQNITILFQVDLLTREVERTYQFDCSTYLVYLGNDLVILSRIQEMGVIVIDLKANPALAVSDITMRPSGTSLQRVGSAVYVTQGNHGVQRFYLSTLGLPWE